jgi:putative RecB family exonuclease
MRPIRTDRITFLSFPSGMVSDMASERIPTHQPTNEDTGSGASPGGTRGLASLPSSEQPSRPDRLSRLSPSRASDFKICPQLFKFRSIDRLPEPTTVYQARGTTAHLALQRLYDLPHTDRTPDRLYDLFREAWSEVRGSDEYSDLFESVEEERRWGIESMTLLANYFSLEHPGRVEPIARELDMTEDLGDITIRGILDRMDRASDGSLVITDYKTGKAPPERYAIPAFFALKIYALLIRRRTGETPAEIRLLYLNGPTLYRLAIDDAQLDAMERQLRALWAAIERAMEEDRFPPRPGRLCTWCAFQDRCPAWADEAAPAAAEAVG